MSTNGQCFVEWKEEFVSQERGNRVVHYFLKDSSGESVLAVVGTERSVRHMFYVIADEFLEAHGEDNSIHSGFKWRSRREVVDWLTSMLSKQQNLNGDRSDGHDSTRVLGFPEYPMNGIARAQVEVGRFAKNFRGRNSDIVWSGSPWMCGKQLKHYPSFSRNGIKIPIQSFVFVMAKGEIHYVAYLEDMYEDKRGLKKVKVRWFHHYQEVKGAAPLRNPHPKEVFMTSYAQVISAECVDGLASVLNREHYDKCLASIPHGFLAKVHMCYRQFRNNRIKPFDLTKLRGYFNQPILSCLGPDSMEEEREKDENAKRGIKRTRPGSDTPARDKSLHKKRVVNQGLYAQLFKVDDKIELLCQDSGIRGCWFRCTVLEVSKKKIKVRYDDLQDEDNDSGNLEEWVPIFKLSFSDKLEMRDSSRPTIRPALSKEPIDELSIEIGSAIDAWWSDGWWEGIVTSVDKSEDSVQVFFPGESLLLQIDKKDLRISREWLGDRWIEIESKPEMVSVCSSGTKPSMSSSVEEDLIATAQPPIITIDNEENQALDLTMTSSDDPSKADDLVNPKKSTSLRDDESSGNADCFKVDEVVEERDDGNKIEVNENGNEMEIDTKFEIEIPTEQEGIEAT